MGGYEVAQVDVTSRIEGSSYRKVRIGDCLGVGFNSYMVALVIRDNIHGLAWEFSEYTGVFRQDRMNQW